MKYLFNINKGILLQTSLSFLLIALHFQISKTCSSPIEIPNVGSFKWAQILSITCPSGNIINHKRKFAHLLQLLTNLVITPGFENTLCQKVTVI